MALLQDKLSMLWRRSWGVILVGDGKGDGSWEAFLQLASWPDWCLFESIMPHPEPPSWGPGRRVRKRGFLTDWSCHLMKAKLIWGRPQATDVGGGPAKAVWRGKGGMGVLLDTGGLGKP